MLRLLAVAILTIMEMGDLLEQFDSVTDEENVAILTIMEMGDLPYLLINHNQNYLSQSSL